MGSYCKTYRTIFLGVKKIANLRRSTRTSEGFDWQIRHNLRFESIREIASKISPKWKWDTVWGIVVYWCAHKRWCAHFRLIYYYMRHHQYKPHHEGLLFVVDSGICPISVEPPRIVFGCAVNGRIFPYHGRTHPVFWALINGVDWTAISHTSMVSKNLLIVVMSRVLQNPFLQFWKSHGRLKTSPFLTVWQKGFPNSLVFLVGGIKIHPTESIAWLVNQPFGLMKQTWFRFGWYVARGVGWLQLISLNIRKPYPKNSTNGIFTYMKSIKDKPKCR